jgi:hypothetical protein
MAFGKYKRYSVDSGLNKKSCIQTIQLRVIQALLACKATMYSRVDAQYTGFVNATKSLSTKKGAHGNIICGIKTTNELVCDYLDILGWKAQLYCVV